MHLGTQADSVVKGWESMVSVAFGGRIHLYRVICTCITRMHHVRMPKAESNTARAPRNGNSYESKKARFFICHPVDVF